MRSEHQGMRLLANVELAGATDDRRQIALLIHGTWAHFGMEIVASLQGVLAEYGIPSLAPNLSLGVNEREGFLACAPEMAPNHGAARAEIGHWVDYLRAQGWQSVVLVGHSRGGAQAADFQAHAADPLVRRLVLLAPMLWREGQMADAYHGRFGVALDAVLEAARASMERPVGPYPLLRCDGVRAPGGTFVSYYDAAIDRHTPSLLQRVDIPVLVFLGSEDAEAAWSDAERAAVAGKANVRFVELTGADHFFRDLYLYDIVEALVGGASP